MRSARNMIRCLSVNAACSAIGAALLMAPSAASAATTPCPSPQTKGVTQLRAGLAPGGYPMGAASCGGAVYAVRDFVTTRCSNVKFGLRHARGGGYRPCATRTDECVLTRRTGRRTGKVSCTPLLNQNALVTFHYRFRP